MNFWRYWWRVLKLAAYESFGLIFTNLPRAVANLGPLAAGAATIYFAGHQLPIGQMGQAAMFGALFSIYFLVHLLIIPPRLSREFKARVDKKMKDNWDREMKLRGELADLQKTPGPNDIIQFGRVVGIATNPSVTPSGMHFESITSDGGINFEMYFDFNGIRLILDDFEGSEHSNQDIYWDVACTRYL